MQTERWIRTRDDIRSELDDVSDPLTLGHSLTELQSDVEKAVVSKRCRVSSLSSLCVRAQVLGYRNNLLKISRISVGQQMIYDKGNAYHRWVQNDASYFGRRRIGWWRCLACRRVEFGLPRIRNCPKCNALPEAFLYEEHEMKLNDPVYVSGHPDMLLSLGKQDIRVVELKSMKHDDWKKLTYPHADHVFQIHGYFCFLPYDSKLPVKVNPNRGLLLYITKADGIREFPIKAFHVTRRPEIVRQIVYDLRMHKAAIDDETINPPIKQECVDAGWSTWKQKSCVAVEICEALHNKENRYGK